VHEVDHDRHVHAARPGFGADPSELVVVAVDQRDPGAVLVGVATLGLVEDLTDHPGGVHGDAGDQPFAPRPWSGAAGWVGLVRCGQDLAWGSGDRGAVVDAADLGEPLAVALLSFGQTGCQLAAGGGLGGGRPQRRRSHHHALAVTRQHQHLAGLAQRR
jgi:hypothetical protein